MSTTATAVRRVAVALAWRPEWPVAAVAVAAWVTLLAIHAGPADHGSHAAHGAGAATPPLTMSVAAIGGWILMSMAMMLPATLPAVRHVALNSIRRRRRRAMAGYVVAYLGVWVAFGIPALTLIAAAGAAGADARLLALGALLGAAGWQASPWKRRMTAACRRTVPLPPTGWRADAACVHFGIRQAGRCIASCWPLMLLMAVLGHGNLVAMALLGAIVVAEERNLVNRRLNASIAGALAAAAAVTAGVTGIA